MAPAVSTVTCALVLQLCQSVLGTDTPGIRCSHFVCQNGGICNWHLNSGAGGCACVDGYTGDECLSPPLQQCDGNWGTQVEGGTRLFNIGSVGGIIAPRQSGCPELHRNTSRPIEMAALPSVGSMNGHRNGGAHAAPRFMQDSGVHLQFVSGYTAQAVGSVVEWQVYSTRRVSTAQLKFWRPRAGDITTYYIVGANAVQLEIGHNLISVAFEDQFQVQPGDVIGWSINGRHAIDFTTGDDEVWRLQGSHNARSVSLTAENSERQNRTYSIMARVSECDTLENWGWRVPPALDEFSTCGADDNACGATHISIWATDNTPPPPPPAPPVLCGHHMVNNLQVDRVCQNGGICGVAGCVCVGGYTGDECSTFEPASDATCTESSCETSSWPDGKECKTASRGLPPVDTYACSVAHVDGGIEVDCHGVSGGGAVADVCGECGGDGSACADVVCQTLRDPNHGLVRYTHISDGKSNAIHFPSVATYECEDGYTAQFALRHCQLDGSWSGSDGSCAESFCEMLPPPGNGEVFYSHHRAFHSSVTFTCDDGYKLEPLAEIEGSIACGDTVSGSTVGARSVHGEAAGEHIYHFAVPNTAYTMYFESCQSVLETVLRITSLDLQQEYFVGQNGTASSTACQNAMVEFSDLPSGEYALTIEGEGTAEGQYSVFMNCSSSRKHCHAACGRCYELARQCPFDPDHLTSCDHPNLNVGDLCEGDGECGTFTDANNCGVADVYNLTARSEENAEAPPPPPRPPPPSMQPQPSPAPPQNTPTSSYGQAGMIPSRCNQLVQGSILDSTEEASSGIWYEFEVVANGTYTIDTCQSSFETDVRILQQSYFGGRWSVIRSCDNCRSTCDGSGAGSQLSALLSAGRYAFAVSGHAGATGDYVVTVHCPVQPARARLDCTKTTGSTTGRCHHGRIEVYDEHTNAWGTVR